MKRVILLICCLLSATAATAQSDMLAPVKSIYGVGDQVRNELVLVVGGYQVAITDREVAKPKVTFGFGFKNVELGFSLLTSPSYAGYTVEQHGFLEQRVGKSIHFGFRLFDIGVPLDRHRRIQLHTGLHLMCDNYVFDSDLTLRRIGGRIVPLMIDNGYKKSKLSTAAFGIPVQVVFRPTKGLTLSALVYGDLIFNSHTKYKKPKVKEWLSGVGAFHLGAGVALAYKGFGLYAKYGFTTLFKNGVGPVTHPVTVGLYFGL